MSFICGGVIHINWSPRLVIPIQMGLEELVALQVSGPKCAHLDTLNAWCAVGVPIGLEDFFQRPRLLRGEVLSRFINLRQITCSVV